MNHYTEQVVHSIINACGFSTATYNSPAHPISISNTSITIGSPLGELTSRELCLYCHYRNIRYSTQFSFLSNPGPSVYRLSEGIFEKRSCPRHGGIIARWLRLDAAYRDGDLRQAPALRIDGSGAGKTVQNVRRVREKGKPWSVDGAMKRFAAVASFWWKKTRRACYKQSILNQLFVFLKHHHHHHHHHHLPTIQGVRV